MGQARVLIVGAGIAGPALAYWLARHGFQPTVLEKAQGLRSSGNPVDVRGGAAEVAGRMGILPRLHEAATYPTGFAFVTASGRWIGPLRVGRPGGNGVEVPRADLSSILVDAVRDEAEYIFGDSIRALDQDTGGVEVSFEHAAPRRFDLVVGADGLHSSLRTLVFGEESKFVRHLGLYIATLPLDRPARDPSTILMYNAPGRSLTVHPVRGNEGAAFIFRGPALQELDRRDVDARKQIIIDAYTGDGWQAPVPPVLPELLDLLRTAEDLYFDAISQVRLPTWSHGRVALLGDAAACVSLFGDGSSLAMIGAATLAEALAANPHDHTAAFRAYESRHRKASRPSQHGYTLAASLLVPSTRKGIVVRNLIARLLPRAPRPPLSAAGST
ncbi:2-polyprenyl-6-methoxyphenol hydroxylase-like FAD-dependent oxidoreductase [Arthrobacter pascens]|uniref:FAD-dependent monooxygenase n=1 Tax=Arthrobacter pascens TaxID=1677 RepID=UPI00278549A4|nr:FAD-dependent monooxygenase [Arthrobacter pascens]MDQ0634310.1 2-polyprenyl-6-methoxyphenol hydroxylase-like FAD-dependent oxidoreductase [Arthrobacter pascens]